MSNTPPYQPHHLEAVSAILDQHVGDRVPHAALVALAQMVADAETPPAIGHNRPPGPSLDPGELDAYLNARLAEWGERLADSDGIFHRYTEATADGIADDDHLRRASLLEQRIKALSKELDGWREADRRPILDAGKTIQGRYASIIDRLDQQAATINRHRTAFLRAKEAAERARAQAEAAERAREAQAAAEAARQRQSAEATAAAIAASEEAEAASRRAAAPPAALVRTHHAGGVATLRRTLRMEITDLGAIPLAFISANEPAILAVARAAKDPDVTSPVPGVRFFYETKA